MMRMRDLMEASRPRISILYHFTPLKNLASLSEHGLDPRFRETNSPIPEGGRMIYLAADADHAANYIHYQQVGEGLILTVDVSSLSLDLLSPDDVDLVDLIPKSRHWSDYTWEQSLRTCGQCAYRGVIAPALIQVESYVAMGDPPQHVGEPLSDFDFDEWCDEQRGDAEE